MKQADVVVLMGSDSDLPFLKDGVNTLKEFGISCEVCVKSAHRSPEAVRTFVIKARENGVKVIIAGAGGAAHLAGVLAAQTTLPVIGVPIPTKELGGMDSLLSTVQMPSGIPVATVAVGKSGAVNAAILAIQILALADKTLTAKLDDYKRKLAARVEEKNARLKKALK